MVNRWHLHVSILFSPNRNGGNDIGFSVGLLFLFLGLLAR
jgi:hypothetical protein